MQERHGVEAGSDGPVAPRRAALGTNREKGRTRDQLYNEAKNLGIEGRSSMNKAQLQRAVDGKKS